MKKDITPLKADASYTYQLWAVTNTQTIYSEKYSLRKEKVAPVISDIRVQNITSQGYDISCIVTDNVGIKKVQFPTWTQKNDQDDLIWHDAILSNGRYTYHVSIADHNNEYGTYITHIYAWDLDDNYSCDGTAADVPSPRIAPTRIDLSTKQESAATVLITATVYPSDADVRTIRWQTSNTSMSQLMKIEGDPYTARLVMFDAGETVVTASVNDGECSGSRTFSCSISKDNNNTTPTKEEPKPSQNNQNNSSATPTNTPSQTTNNSTGQNNTAPPSDQAATKGKTLVDLPAVSIAKTNRNKTKCTISWKKLSTKNQKKVSKIQIEYSTDKKFKKNVKTVTAKNTATSKTITKLKSGKTYYIRIRTYTKKSNVVHVSKWSKVKTVKRKK